MAALLVLDGERLGREERHMTRHVQLVRVPSWGLAAHGAIYYGWRWCLHIGPWLVFLWPSEPRL